MKKLKIALLSPIQEVVPPPKYGGSELIVYYLAEALHQRGHHVTVFAREESQISAELDSAGIDASQLQSTGEAIASYYRLHFHLIDRINRGEFDLLHNHENWRFVALSQFIKNTPVLTTAHNFFDERYHQLYKYGQRGQFISISDRQRDFAPKELKFAATIYHGIDFSQFTFEKNPAEPRYLLWVGRIIQKKGVADAIEVAKKTGMPLKIAGNIVESDSREKEYYETKVKPAIDNGTAEYIGEVGGREKAALFAGAYAFLNPIDWEEPFGLVVPEANISGVPVIAYARGSMPEIIENGVNGFLVDPGDLNQMADAVTRVGEIDRAECRSYAERRFSIPRMIDQYEEVYRQIIER